MSPTSEPRPAQSNQPANPGPLLGRVLGYGSRLSVLVLALGFAVAIAQDQRGGVGLRVGALETALAHGKGTGILGLGMAILICTPIVREAAALVLFARYRERTFSVLAGIVLALVACSTLIGGH